MASQTSSHQHIRTRSYLNLENARQKAAKTEKGYNSIETRTQLHTIFRERFGKDPHNWQLDVTKAIILGLDCVVIAGTGAGKTMPFMMPLMLDSQKKVIVISPLKVLQEEQASRFKEMKISAVAVNGDSWSSTLQKELEQNKYQGILASPEMCMKHGEFRKTLTNSSFKGIAAVIVDEAHCIKQWGADFRKEYSELGRLRAFFPPEIPFIAMSATVTPLCLREIRSTLGIDAASSFHLNLGNDRPNISYKVHQISSSREVSALRPLLTRTGEDPSHPEDIIKGIIFVDSKILSQTTVRTIRDWFPEHLRKYVDYMHALRSPKAKRRAMKRFRKGKIRILVATEAAGMGADIPDIEQVIQFGIPGSLSIWIQRAGRAGRSREINARAILLFEKAMFEKQKRKRRKPGTSLEPEGNESGEDGEDGEDAGEVGEGEDVVEDDASDEFQWKKKVEDALREWIETSGCRQAVADKHFDNPVANRPLPTGVCCDNCSSKTVTDPCHSSTRASTPRTSAPQPDVRPSTPESGCDHDGSSGSSTHSTPSKSTNIHNKRPILSARTPARRGDHRKQAIASLETWRFRTVRDNYPGSLYTDSGFMPDSVIKALASNTHIQTVADMRVHIRWAFVDRHGPSVLEVLKKIDHHYHGQREAAKRAKAEQRAAETQARQLQKRLAHEAEQARKKDERDRLRSEKAAAKENKRLERAELRRQLAEARKAMKPPPKRARRPPLVGSLVLNMSTPLPLSSSSPMLQAGPASSPSMFLNFKVQEPNSDSTPHTPLRQLTSILSSSMALLLPSSIDSSSESVSDSTSTPHLSRLDLGNVR